MLNGSQWAQKPPLGTPIDRGNPISQRLAALWAVNEGTGLTLHDLTGNGSDAAITGATWTPTAAGAGINFAAGQIAYVASASPLHFAPPFSIFATVVQSASNSNGAFIVSKRNNANANPPFEMSFDIAGGTYNNQLLYQFGDSGGVYHSFFSGLTVPLGVPVAVGMSVSTSQVFFWVNGQLGTVGSLSGTVPLDNTTVVQIGNYGYEPNNFYLDGSLGILALWTGVAISAASQVSLAANPNQLFAPPLTRKLGYFTSIPTSSTSGEPAITGIGYQFNEAVNAGSLSIVVTVSATGATVPGTVSYNSTTHLASFIPSATTPLVAGVKYIVTVSGATALDGTLMTPVTFPFQPGGVTGGRWTPALGRSRARLRP